MRDLGILVKSDFSEMWWGRIKGTDQKPTELRNMQTVELKKVPLVLSEREAVECFFMCEKYQTHWQAESHCTNQDWEVQFMVQ